MSHNRQHYTAFLALLKLSGLQPKVSEAISLQLSCIDNNAQDQLLALIADELHKSKNPPPVEQDI